MRSSGSRGGGAQVRTVPMKLDVKGEESVMISHEGQALGQSPVIIDASSVTFPLEVRVHFEEGHRVYELTKHEPIVTFVFEEGEKPEEDKIEEAHQEKKAKARAKRRRRPKVENMKGTKNISPY